MQQCVVWMYVCICQNATQFIGSILTYATLGTTTCFDPGCWSSSGCT